VLAEAKGALVSTDELMGRTGRRGKQLQVQI